MKRFRGLPKEQRECFEKIAAGARFRHHPRTLAILEHKGLIEFETMTVKFPGRLGSITATLPYVPIPIHMEWCAWCAENVEVESDETDNKPSLWDWLCSDD